MTPVPWCRCGGPCPGTAERTTGGLARRSAVAALKALVAQLAGGLVALAVLHLGVLPAPAPAWLLAVIQGVAAAALAAALRAERWWLAIHLGFMPAVVAAASLAIAPVWYLAGFVLLALLFGSGAGGRAPLYLSNAATVRAVAALLPAAAGQRIADLGGGTGSLLAPLAAARPDLAFTGIEAAPLPYLIGRLRMAGAANVAWRRGDFWREHLGAYAMVYVFLSPVPMARLWAKACAEMRPGSLLVSNSFAIPGVAATESRRVGDRRGSCLYVYRVPPRQE